MFNIKNKYTFYILFILFFFIFWIFFSKYSIYNINKDNTFDQNFDIKDFFLEDNQVCKNDKNIEENTDQSSIEIKNETSIEPCFYSKDIKEKIKSIDFLNRKSIIKNIKFKNVSKGETICCRVMEKIYGVPFVSERPTWLKNPNTGRALELDCYNSELKIAVEYNGRQHYEWPNFTNQDKVSFHKQLDRDNLKKKICFEHGIYLIIVPFHVKNEKIPEYIVTQLPEIIKNKLKKENSLFNDFIEK